jgi:uncharacterized protein YndB with AHSA1/START domain
MTMADKLDLVLERTIDAPVALVWQAYTDPEHLKRWFAPRPYEITECELDATPGGIFRSAWLARTASTRVTAMPAASLEVVEGRKLAWTSALGPGYRPAEMAETGCESFPMTAIVTFEDAGNGKTAYKAVALHKDAADREKHEQMGFNDGWGTVAASLRNMPSRCAQTREKSGAGKTRAPYISNKASG